jgi:hypothetical protein
MWDFERLGVFYLGRRQDPESKAAEGDLVLYDSRHLVTHAMAVGMTGSGKTGLGVALIEEAAIDGVPVIVIDPKGDLTNLLLTFPSLRPEDFEPWVSAEEAERAGLSRAAFAAAQAERWKSGLAGWGQDGARIQRLRDAADFTIFTPGSTAGVPVSVLGSFAPPQIDDEELLRERIQVTVSSLLALAGVEADEPMKSREHILLSTILSTEWQAGNSPDLASLVHAVQQPSIQRIGVMDIDSFFPPKDRFAFAMSINALLASPAFEVWTRGAPLDVAALLRTPAGKPRVSIFSIAHLDDGQRMFFVALLLNAVTGWMRGQQGTASLRAMLYMDEIFGFFPPVANPPSKLPLLTLLKQGRAAGLGIVLATQNPVDLDYKGLSNIGTWWLGRLQTDRDKARVLDGLESASQGKGFERAEVDRLLSGLTSRVFLMRNVHQDGLTLFQSRWAMSYLRGPLSRDEIKKLTAGKAVPESVSAGSGAPAPAAPAPSRSPLPSAGDRPVVSPDIPQYFAPAPPGSPQTPLQPFLYGAADVRFVDRKLKLDAARLVTRVTPIAEGAVPLDWRQSTPVSLSPDALVQAPPLGATFLPLPGAGSKTSNYPEWTKQFIAWAGTNEALEVLRSPSTGGVSRPDESERDFRARLQHSAREARDEALDRLRRKYAPKQTALDEKLRRARQTHARESEQAAGQKMQTAISLGATVLGALFGRKTVGVGTVGRATTTMRGAGRAMKESQDVQRAQETVETVEEQRRLLEEDFLTESKALEAATDAATEALERVVVQPKKADVQVKVVALVWMPMSSGRP